MWQLVEPYFPSVFTILFFIGWGMYFWDAGGGRQMQRLFRRHTITWFILSTLICGGAVTVVSFVRFGEVSLAQLPLIVTSTLGCVLLLALLLLGTTRGSSSGPASGHRGSSPGRGVQEEGATLHSSQQPALKAVPPLALQTLHEDDEGELQALEIGAANRSTERQ